MPKDWYGKCLKFTVDKFIFIIDFLDWHMKQIGRPDTWLSRET
jgi:hypothetical protein